jgi:hypothetical protein
MVMQQMCPLWARTVHVMALQRVAHNAAIDGAQMVSWPSESCTRLQSADYCATAPCCACIRIDLSYMYAGDGPCLQCRWPAVHSHRQTSCNIQLGSRSLL